MGLVNRTVLMEVIGIALGIFAVYFCYISSLGLYEDDFFFIGNSLHTSFSALLQYSLHCFQTFPEGRPLGFVLPAWFTFVGEHVGGLVGIYLIAYGILVINALLVLAIARKVTTGAWVWVVVLVYILFPADTTKSMLTHAFQLQAGLCFCLLAMLVYSSGKTIAGYGLASLALLCYEASILPFLTFPLLLQVSLRTWAKHLACMVVVLVLYLLVRFHAVEEARLAYELSVNDWVDLFRKTVVCSLLGPLSSGYAFALRLVTGLVEGNGVTWAIGASVGLSCYWLLEKTNHPNHLATNYSEAQQSNRPLLIGGGLMVLSAYLMAFIHYPATALSNRGTSVHLAASLGYPWLTVGIGRWMSEVWNLERWLLRSVAMVAACWASFHVVIEQDFVASWQKQRWFWKELVRVCPDALVENQLILVTHPTPNDNRYVSSFSWAMDLTLAQLFQFPAQWKMPPIVTELENPIEPNRIFTHPYRWYDAQLAHHPIAAVAVYPNRVERLEGKLFFHGEAISLTSKKPIENSFPPGRLNEFLLR